MVLYNKQAELDLHNILIGLATWKKHPLGFEHAMSYVDDIQKSSDDICTGPFHKQCVFQIHKKHGDKVFQYKRNRQTQWNVIYKWDKKNRIAYVNKILNSKSNRL